MEKHFYAVIIGTEILNGRREDKHFEFLKNELAKYGHELFASFVIKDDATLIENVYRLIAADEKSVLFSFGGIGTTPDDLTREIAAKVFRNAPLQMHPQFQKDILERFGTEGSQHRINMAMLPPGATLLKNPINNMSGFALDKRFFFTPGFPSMAHPMIRNVIETYFKKSVPKYRKTLYAHCSENQLIDTMKKLPKSVELSSLPVFQDGKPNVELSLSSTNEKEVMKYFQYFIDDLKAHNIKYTLL